MGRIKDWVIRLAVAVMTMKGRRREVMFVVRQRVLIDSLLGFLRIGSVETSSVLSLWDVRDLCDPFKSKCIQ